MPKASNVQTKIAECVDEVLKQLGQSVRQVVYFHLEKNFGLKREDIPNQPVVFSKALYSIFGQGANVIEGIIVQKIQEKFKLNFDSQTSIVKAIETTKRRNERLKQGAKVGKSANLN